ncbi:MAG TPA: DUF4393 domain-containing protein [Candidatus Rifleibacterium sp.]|nr:DUF4393 domain-containing protein [Candidatus Rifleibacterium sp.]HPW58580.1 DUF4393 domain-containing protein [Candidatus Rifleibacterium sp.]
MTEKENKNPINEAFGPAATNFGKEIAPLGTDLAQLVVWAAEKVKTGINIGFAIKEETWRYFREKLQRRLEKEKLGDITPPKMLIAGPTLDHLRFLSEEDRILQDMFINLFAASMLKGIQSKAHPAFVEVLKQMSPDEAKILWHIFKIPNQTIPCLRLDEMSSSVEYTTKIECFSAIGQLSHCDFPENTAVYLKNMVRLGILQHLPECALMPLSIYKPLEETPEIESVKQTISEAMHQSRVIFGILNLSDFGRLFCDVCVRNC